MVAGIGVVALPIAILGGIGYALWKKIGNDAKKSTLAEAMDKFDKLRTFVLQWSLLNNNKECLEEELKKIEIFILAFKTTIDKI